MNQKRFAADQRKVVVAIGVSLLAIVLVSFLVQFYQGKAVVGKAAAAGHACGGVTNGLISWWSFEEEDTGTVVISDSLGNNPVSALGFQSAPGKIGKAYSLPGTDNNFAVLANQPSQNPANGITISAWIKPASVNGYKTIISKPSSTGWSAPYARYHLRINAGKLEFWTNQYSGRNIQSTTSLQSNTWYHVVATYDGSNEKIYINGALDNTLAATGSITSSTEPLIIGSRNGGGNNDADWFHGLIDELAFYSRALNEDEIKKLYEIGNQDTCQPVITAEEENCNSDQDDDSDGQTNCFDTDCYTDANCASQPCAAGKTIAWSFQYPEEGTATTPERAGCCKDNQCYDGATCVEFGTEDSATPKQLCDTDRNWYKCETDGQLSKDGKFRCAGQEWETVCSPATKYKLEDGPDPDSTANNRICDGLQFHDCSNNKEAESLSTLKVKVTCSSAAAAGTITVTELICNNGLDDDNDGKVDVEDTNDTPPDCTGLITYVMNNNHYYEIVSKATDSFRININHQ